MPEEPVEDTNQRHSQGEGRDLAEPDHKKRVIASDQARPKMHKLKDMQFANAIIELRKCRAPKKRGQDAAGRRVHEGDQKHLGETH